MLSISVSCSHLVIINLHNLLLFKNVSKEQIKIHPVTNLILFLPMLALLHSFAQNQAKESRAAFNGNDQLVAFSGSNQDVYSELSGQTFPHLIRKNVQIRGKILEDSG